MNVPTLTASIEVSFVGLLRQKARNGKRQKRHIQGRTRGEIPLTTMVLNYGIMVLCQGVAPANK